MALPQLTPEQRAAALKKAQEVRSARAKLRKEIAAGKVTIEDVFKKVKDPVVGKMRVKLLIKTFPGVGDVKTAQIMEELKIAENRRVQGLGDRQKEALIEILLEK